MVVIAAVVGYLAGRVCSPFSLLETDLGLVLVDPGVIFLTACGFWGSVSSTVSTQSRCRLLTLPLTRLLQQTSAVQVRLFGFSKLGTCVSSLLPSNFRLLICCPLCTLSFSPLLHFLHLQCRVWEILLVVAIVRHVHWIRSNLLTFLPSQFG